MKPAAVEQNPTTPSSSLRLWCTPRVALPMLVAVCLLALIVVLVQMDSVELKGRHHKPSPVQRKLRMLNKKDSIECKTLESKLRRQITEYEGYLMQLLKANQLLQERFNETLTLLTRCTLHRQCPDQQPTPIIQTDWNVDTTIHEQDATYPIHTTAQTNVTVVKVKVDLSNKSSTDGGRGERSNVNLLDNQAFDKLVENATGGSKQDKKIITEQQKANRLGRKSSVETFAKGKIHKDTKVSIEPDAKGQNASFVERERGAHEENDLKNDNATLSRNEKLYNTTGSGKNKTGPDQNPPKDDTEGKNKLKFENDSAKRKASKIALSREPDGQPQMIDILESEPNTQTNRKNTKRGG